MDYSYKGLEPIDNEEVNQVYKHYFILYKMNADQVY